MSDEGLPQEELDLLRQQMEKEEFEADDARLSSMESFELWVASHPALRQMHIVQNLHQIGPALLEALKRLLGF